MFAVMMNAEINISVTGPEGMPLASKTIFVVSGGLIKAAIFLYTLIFSYAKSLYFSVIILLS